MNTLNVDGTPAVRVRLPKKWNNEQFARAELMMGANHIRVLCFDGITRTWQNQGTMKKRTWIRERRYPDCYSLELPGCKV